MVVPRTRTSVVTCIASTMAMLALRTAPASSIGHFMEAFDTTYGFASANPARAMEAFFLPRASLAIHELIASWNSSRWLRSCQLVESFNYLRHTISSPTVMSIHMRPHLFLIRPQSLDLSSRALRTGKKLQGGSQTRALRLPARSLPRTPSVIVAGAVLSTSMSLKFKESALCQDITEGPSGSDDPSKKNDDPVEKIIDVVLGNCGELTLAGSLGFCSGYALKQLGKAAAVAVGLVFVMAQVAAYSGYIDIKWGKVQKDLITKVDPNGDGKLDSQDAKLWYRKLLKIMKTNLPSTAGFSSGFAFGIYYS